jgi:hypothetical protein
MPAWIEQVVVDGPELKVRPLEDRKSPIVLRIENAFPHGTAFRYDLVYYGLEAGTFDLRDYLVRADGSSMDDVVPLPVEIRPLLPPGQVEPSRLKPGPTPRLGGYRVAMLAAVVAWSAGVFVILLVGRKRRADADAATGQPVSLADRLRPAVEKAVAGEITGEEKSELERLLLAYWRRRLGLEDVRPPEAMAALRAHPEAGPLLDRLELWLHRPGADDKVDVAQLLRPYETVRADGDENWSP